MTLSGAFFHYQVSLERMGAFYKHTSLDHKVIPQDDDKFYM
jgi:hypothetical protein